MKSVEPTDFTLDERKSQSEKDEILKSKKSMKNNVVFSLREIKGVKSKRKKKKGQRTDPIIIMSSSSDLLAGGKDNSQELIKRMKKVMELLKEEDPQKDYTSAMTLAKCSDYSGPGGPLEACVPGKDCKNLDILEKSDTIGRIYAYSEKHDAMARCVPVGYVNKNTSSVVNNYQELLELLDTYANDVKPKLDELMQFMGMVTDCSILSTEEQCRSPLLSGYNDAPMCVWREADPSDPSTDSGCGGTCQDSTAYDNAKLEIVARKMEDLESELDAIRAELRKSEFSTFSELSNATPMDPTVARNFRLFKSLVQRRNNIEAKLASLQITAANSITAIKNIAGEYINMKALEAECSRLAKDSETGKYNLWGTCLDSGDVCQVVHAMKEKDDDSDDKSRSGYITKVHSDDAEKTFNGKTSFCLPKGGVNITYAYNPDSGRVLFLDHKGKPTHYVDAAASIYGAMNWAAQKKDAVLSGAMAFFDANAFGNWMRIFRSDDEAIADEMDDELDGSLLSESESSAAKARLLQFRLRALYNQIEFYTLKNVRVASVVGNDGNLIEARLNARGNKNKEHVKKLALAYNNLREHYIEILDELKESDVGAAYRIQVFDEKMPKQLKADLMRDTQAIYNAQRRALAQLNARYNFTAGEIVTFHHAAAPSGGNRRGLTPWTEKNASNVVVKENFSWNPRTMEKLDQSGELARQVKVDYQGQTRTVDAAYCKKIYESYNVNTLPPGAGFPTNAVLQIAVTGAAKPVGSTDNREVLCIVVNGKPKIDRAMVSGLTGYNTLNVKDTDLTRKIKEKREHFAKLDKLFGLHRTSSLSPLAWIKRLGSSAKNYVTSLAGGDAGDYDVQSVSMMSTASEGAPSLMSTASEGVPSLMSTASEGVPSLMSTASEVSLPSLMSTASKAASSASKANASTSGSSSYSSGSQSYSSGSQSYSSGSQSSETTGSSSYSTGSSSGEPSNASVQQISLMSTASKPVSEYASTNIPSAAQSLKNEAFELMSTEGALSGGGASSVSIHTESTDAGSSNSKGSVDVDKLYEEFYANQFQNVSDGSSVSHL